MGDIPGQTKLRLYQSALNDVKYVYGAPVRYSTDKAVLEQRERDIEEARAEQRRRIAAAEAKEEAARNV